MLLTQHSKPLLKEPRLQNRLHRPLIERINIPHRLLERKPSVLGP